MSVLHHRKRESGQTIVAMALVLGILMIVCALVIDVGSTQRVRTETQYVCDAGALAGVTELLATKDPASARVKALDICARNGYVVGQNGVTKIEAVAFNHQWWPEEDASKIDIAGSDRYQVVIHRELPQYIANIIGIGRTGTQLKAVAAILGEVPIPVDFGSTVGFPDRANLSQFGPDAPYTFGDAYSTKRLDNGSPNPTYQAGGYLYDFVVPPDLEASSGSSFVRVELYDADTINRGNHVVKNPSLQVDTNGDPTEPEQGGLDEIRFPPPNGNANSSAADFVTNSTETEFTVRDRSGNVIATARYGPSANTPFWYHRDAPASDPIRNATPVNGDAAQAQIAADLRWITPQGFEFDTNVYPGPYTINVETIAGSSENGYGLRLSTQRASGEAFDLMTTGVTNSSALQIFGHGKVPINFSVSDITKIPIGSVPSGAKQVVVTNFDTDVGAQGVDFTMSSFDSTTGQGKYPVLFPVVPPNNTNNPPNGYVQDAAGLWYTSVQPGDLSKNGTFATSGFDTPDPVVVPQTDGNGNLLFDGNGRITVVDQRNFEGGDLEITYKAGATDTSVWEVSFSGSPVDGAQQIVLIR